MKQDKICQCGEPASYHVEGCEQCIISDCECKEFVEILCDKCQDTGQIEIMGGSEKEEWGVIDVKPCDCQNI